MRSTHLHAWTRTPFRHGATAGRMTSLLLLALTLGDPQEGAAQPIRDRFLQAPLPSAPTTVSWAGLPTGQLSAASLRQASLVANGDRVARRVVRRATSQLGTPYLYGAQAPGEAFDCSGFVQWAMAIVRRDIPRVSAEQAAVGVAVPRDTTHLRPGDLVAFGRDGEVEHIGIYLGRGRYIHASSRLGAITISTLPSARPSGEGWWVSARRIFGPPPPPSLAQMLRSVTAGGVAA